MTSFRTHLALGRVSNLPTVWSNILCAWIIVGGYNPLQLASLLLGASLLYIGGMYLNDYCDRDFDQEFRPDSPIPSGSISAAKVQTFSIAFLLLGFACLAWTGFAADRIDWQRFLPTAFAAGTVLAIVLYDSNHKQNPIAPIYMAACRALLYLTVASAFDNGIDLNNLIATGTIFVYVMGITFLARTESTTNAIDYPALAMLIAPILGAFYYNRHGLDPQQIAALALFIAWMARSFLRARVDGQLIIGKTIGPLIASIPLLDLLILSSLNLATQTHLIIFASLFALTTAAQRFIRAS
ncbi:UbiA family prenyltransferase [Pelagicoccus mobilis]|uniref:UbiA family prenyltransferase n=1 Tax=Pelagicoccus mobilis TaxID=415221 RepID=A0A934S2J9_9BACT|nr:UbiA family prenyltransferase [Pelagicoccus mobilis]MBK1880020.1 UbiA family prenyltransferase [Pelagicoccus mobilis]